MNYPKITICVPIFGSERYIEKCARSLFKQKYPNIEFVFVNDCTKDGSVDVLKSVILDYPLLADCIKIINHEINLGLAAARLTGLNSATGDYIWFVDADDWVEDNALVKLQVPIHDGNDLIVFSFYEEHETMTVKKKVENVNVSRVLLHDVSPSIWKCVIKRSVLIKYSLQPVVGINYIEDFFMLSRLVLVSSKIITLSNLYLYHYNCTNMSSIMNSINIKAKEQCAYAASLIYKFYVEHNSDNLYKNELTILMLRRYLDLYESDSNNSFCKKLKLSLKKHSYGAYQLLLFPVQINVKRFVLRVFVKAYYVFNSKS